MKVEQLKVKIFADGADKAAMVALVKHPHVSGFTTNPTLMRKAGITDYKAFALDVLSAIPKHPISFEVFADDFATMERQAMDIASWGKNVYVKVPITTTGGEFSGELVERLSRRGVQLNVTALMTLEQVRRITDHLEQSPSAFVSVFAGRIADTGRDPVPLMAAAVELMRSNPKLELIWASPRELLNIFQADAIGCHVITVTNDVLKKLEMVGKDLADYSRETVQMFFDDAKKAGFAL